MQIKKKKKFQYIVKYDVITVPKRMKYLEISKSDAGFCLSKKPLFYVKKNELKNIFIYDVTVFVLFFCFICHIYPPFTRKQIVSLYFGREVRTRLGVAFFEVYGPPVFNIKVGRPVKCLAQGHNKRTCRLVLHNLP